RAAVAQYKQLRALVRDAKIIHLLPPRDTADGLGWGWDAIQAVAPDQNRALVMVYRAQGGGDTQIIRPRGLRASQRYRVSYADSTTSSEHSGAELATSGLTVSIGQLQAEIITLTAVA
ncbi:MAG: GH36 C-terminal domain-containing protein, partial [Roseiflexaceae bacterium]|nr:GH36 C-terminal domain-containing protein [Roseiflexaceae bacterium]